MEILAVTNDKYIEIVKEPFSAFDTSDFIELNKNGFQHAVYCKYSTINVNTYLRHYIKLFLHDKCPLIKTSIFRSKSEIRGTWELLNKYTDYDIELIKKDLKYNTYRKKLSLFEWIFSITNDEGKRHKVITIVGLRL